MTDALRQECTDCGFIYDPADYGGDVLFYLEDWKCPDCGAGVDKFDFALDEDKTGPRTVPSNFLAVTVIEAPDGKASELFGVEISRLGLLRTPAGNLVSSPSSALLLHMVRELEETPDPSCGGRNHHRATSLMRIPNSFPPSVTSSWSTQQSTAMQLRTLLNTT